MATPPANAKSLEAAIDRAACAIATADYGAAIDAATFVMENASALKTKDRAAWFRIDQARCLHSYAERCAGNVNAMLFLDERRAFNTERDGADIRAELDKLARRAKLAESDPPARAKHVLAYCMRHLIFWRETLAAGVHTRADVSPANVDPMIEPVRVALADRIASRSDRRTRGARTRATPRRKR